VASSGGPLLCGPLCGSSRRLLLTAFCSAFLRHSFTVICLSFSASAAVLSHNTDSLAHLLHHPDLTPSEIRSRLLKPRHTTYTNIPSYHIPPQFVDSMYRTQMDALPTGVRCPKKTNKGLCDLCWFLEGKP